MPIPIAIPTPREDGEQEWCMFRFGQMGNSVFNPIEAMRRLMPRNKIAKETLWALLTKGMTFVLLFALDVFLARYLGKVRYGQWSFFFSLLTILLLISHFGINSSAQRYIAQHNGTPLLRPILASSTKLRVGAGVLFAVLLLALHWPVAQFLERPNLLGGPELARLLVRAVPLIFVMGLVEYLRHVFMGLHRNRYSFILNGCDYGLRLILVVAFLMLSKDLIAVVYSFLVAGVITTALGFILLYYGFYAGLEPCTQSFLKEILRYSVPMAILGIGFVILTELDNLMIGLLLDDSGQVGIYAVAQRIVVKLPQLNLAIAMGSLPLFARMNPANKDYLEKLLYRLLRLNLYIFGGICAGIVATSWLLIPLIYGNEYRGAILPLNILTVYLMVFSCSIYLSGVLDYQGLAMKRAINLAVAIGIKVVLNLVLIPRFGIAGAAFATSVCGIPYLALNWLEVRRRFRTA